VIIVGVLLPIAPQLILSLYQAFLQDHIFVRPQFGGRHLHINSHACMRVVLTWNKLQTSMF